MATKEQVALLKFFRWEEFKHPELMDARFLVFLDDVRQEYGGKIILTSDARTPAENAAASGSSPKSRHLVGQAVDMKFPPTAHHLWALVAAIFKCQRALPIELEIVHGPADAHIHLAWLPAGQASKIEVALD